MLRRKVMERGGWAERRASEAFRGARRGWSAVGRAADSACLGRKRIGALALAVACAAAGCAGGEPALMEPVASAREAHDLVIAGGRVIDPESGLDAVRHVGIQDGTVVAISEDPLEGSATVDAAGLAVAPGFVDLHAHGQDPASSRYQAMDGVTTALELEIGAFPVERWYARRGGASLINYGASVSHQAARIRALGSAFARSNANGTFSLGESDDDTLYRAASDEELARLRQLMERGLREGGIGLGFGLSYTPGASHRELLQMFQVAAEYEAPAFIHLRSAAAFERGGALAPFQEVIANAAVTGAPLHIVHMNSTSGTRADEALAMIRGARERGIDVTTEAYPYTASASLIESPLFDGWDGRPRDAYRSLQWVDTGERLTPETFALYRRQGGWVIMHGRSEEINEWIVGQPDVIAASDGIPFSQGRAHPRGAGTFARILGHYARDRGALSLMDALRKMTLLPARRLESIVPEMTRKGRVQVGSDADLTIFDPQRIIDRATYDAPDQYSAGIEHVLVGGTFVVRDGALVEGVQPGRPLRGRHLEQE
ncbi:MAG: amidohydrolase family protein [Acidobacteria bacterium]|nr:amidohydrolase family protein [Acidobacteriota bacterium]